jgi:DNA-binding SARP family transcriptional activator
MQDSAVAGRVEGVPHPLGGPKQRVVVAVLVAAAGRPVPVDVLLEAIYGEEAAVGGRRTLQTYVSNLRQVLGDVIVRRGDAYVLTCTGSEIDSVQFGVRPILPNPGIIPVANASAE